VDYNLPEAEAAAAEINEAIGSKASLSSGRDDPLS